LISSAFSSERTYFVPYNTIANKLLLGQVDELFRGYIYIPIAPLKLSTLIEMKVYSSAI